MKTHRITLAATWFTTAFLLVACSQNPDSRPVNRMIVAPPIVVTGVRSASQVDTMSRARNRKPDPVGNLLPSKTASFTSSAATPASDLPPR